MVLDRKLVSIIVPFYNEDEAVQPFYAAVCSAVDGLDGIRTEIICVDDGSRDDTLQKLLVLAERDGRMRIVELSRNFGKEAALTAGLDMAKGDAVILIDADLQDPPELIPSLVAAWQGGADVVLARRQNRSTNSLLKGQTAALFYRTHNWLSREKIPADVGDFRLMDRSVVEAVRQLPERQRFMKGLFAWVGFKTTVVDYNRGSRSAGSTKFSWLSLLNLATDSIVSFSIAPLRLFACVGGLSAVATLLYAAYIVLHVLIHGYDVPGYASLFIAVLFFGSLQLMGIGLLGEYVGKTYLEAKQRPLYIIRRLHKGTA